MDGKTTPLPASGSQRRYFRIETLRGTILKCISENVRENETFISLDRYLLSRGFKVPEIYEVSPDGTSYSLQDLGDRDLLKAIMEKEIKSQDLFEVICELVRFQRLPREEWEGIVEFPPFDADLIDHDFHYAIDNLLTPLFSRHDGETWQPGNSLIEELNRLKIVLLSYPKSLWGLMYRDFQSRNILLSDGEFYFIDFQSARYGPGIYDLVSFAWQAKAGFSSEEKMALVNYYADKMQEEAGNAADVRSVILSQLPCWAMFRIIQTLGAYGLRGLKEGKSHFIESIPPALNNLLNILEGYNLKEEYPELKHIVGRLISFF